MKNTLIILSVLALLVSACGQNNTKKHSETINDKHLTQDTVVVKRQNALNNPAWGTLYSKSYSYYWLTGKDTLDLTLYITEYEKGGSFSLRVFHKKPMFFTAVLKKIEECFPLISENFDLSNPNSFNFMAPIYYLDLAKKLSEEYEQEFGQKNIDYTKLNNFLLESSLSLQLNNFFNPLNKKVKSYELEKFHLVDKEYYDTYFPSVDFTEYPEFTFNAHSGISVSLENK